MPTLVVLGESWLVGHTGLLKARENNRSKKMTGYLLWIMVYYVYAFQPESQKTTNNTAALGSI
jgi:hypothetical protein